MRIVSGKLQEHNMRTVGAWHLKGYICNLTLDRCHSAHEVDAVVQLRFPMLCLGKEAQRAHALAMVSRESRGMNDQSCV